MSNVISGVGTTLHKYDEVDKRYVKITEITGIDGPALTRDVINITSLDSQDGYMEFKSGKRSSGALSLSMNFSREMYDLFKADFESDTHVLYKLTFNDADLTTFLFTGMIDSLPLTIPLDDKISMDVSLQVNGRILVSSAAFVPEEDALFVSPLGSDSNSGTYTSPYATLNKALSVLVAGQTVYMREGTYNMSINAYSTSRAVYITGKHGNANLFYKIAGYPGERVVLDFSGISYAGTRYGFLIDHCSYWKIENLEFTGLTQYTTSSAYAYNLQYSSYLYTTNCAFHHNQGKGTSTYELGAEIVYTNCDGYANYDPTSSQSGGNADGFGIYQSTDPNSSVRFVNCRAWDNSDDGFDTYNHVGLVTFDNCWAWHNGYIPGTEISSGNGTGFKLGQLLTAGYDTTVRRILRNCVAFKNKQAGFNQNNCNAIVHLYNCTSYLNTTRGFWFWSFPGLAHVVRNCISYANVEADQWQTGYIHDHNSWDAGVTVTNADFVSLDFTEAQNPREADGTLPDINFLHLTQGSDLINAGVDVGLPFRGVAPDIGAFEY